MKYHEWLRTRRYYTEEELESSIAQDAFDPQYYQGVFEYAGGYVMEYTEAKAKELGVRYWTISCNIDEHFEHLHDAEEWLWLNWCQAELNQDTEEVRMDGGDVM